MNDADPDLSLLLVLASCAGAPKPLLIDLGTERPSETACAAEGPCTIVDYQGNKSAEGELRGGIPAGAWKLYDVKGRPREEGEFVAGKRQGEWKLYGVFTSVSGSGAGFVKLATRPYESSEANAAGRYEHGAMKGPWVLTAPEVTREFSFSGQLSPMGMGILHGPYFERVGGQTTLEGRFENGAPVGEWRKWYPTGKLRGVYAPPEGEFTEFFESGAKKRAGFVAGSADVFKLPLVEWADQVPLRRDGSREPWVYATKVATDGTPVSDLGAPCPPGTTIEGAIDGDTVEQWCQKQEANGVHPKHGPFRAWRLPRLLVVEGEYKDGLKHGPWRTHFWTGQLQSYSEYTDGKRHGAHRELRENGTLVVEGAFKNDRPVGEWSYFSSNGQIERKESR